MTTLYLDLNHWIELSHARLGRAHAKPQYRDMYDELARRTRAGDVVVPLSAIHYSELHDRSHPRRFEDLHELAITMATISRYQALPPRNQLAEAQLTAAVATVSGHRTPPGFLTPGLGDGVGYAQFGRPLRGELSGGAGGAVELPQEKVRAAILATEDKVGNGWRYSRRDADWEGDWRAPITALFAEAAEFVILRGPRPDELPDLRARGYNPEALEQIMSDVTLREIHMQRELFRKPASERHPSDIATCAPLAHDEGATLLGRACLAVGLPVTWAVDGGKSTLTALVDGTPVFDIERALRLPWLLNSAYRIKRNDLYDMAALGLAVSMCDVVATDTSACARLREAGVGATHNCHIVASAEAALEAV